MLWNPAVFWKRWYTFNVIQKIIPWKRRKGQSARRWCACPGHLLWETLHSLPFSTFTKVRFYFCTMHAPALHWRKTSLIIGKRKYNLITLQSRHRWNETELYNSNYKITINTSWHKYYFKRHLLKAVIRQTTMISSKPYGGYVVFNIKCLCHKECIVFVAEVPHSPIVKW